MNSQAFGGKRGDDGGGTDHDAVIRAHSMQQQAHVQIFEKKNTEKNPKKKLISVLGQKQWYNDGTKQHPPSP